MSKNKDDSNSTYRFIDLTPVDDADIDGSYEDALNSALENDRIKINGVRLDWFFFMFMQANGDKRYDEVY